MREREEERKMMKGSDAAERERERLSGETGTSAEKRKKVSHEEETEECERVCR